MFKRFLCAALAAMMLLAGVAALADTDNGSFTATFVKIGDYSAEDFCENAEMRAAFTWFVFFDYVSAGFDNETLELDTQPTYVVRCDKTLCVFVAMNDGRTIIFAYTPGEDTISYSISDGSTSYSASTVEAVIQADPDTDAWYKNDETVMLTVGSQLVSVLNGQS